MDGKAGVRIVVHGNVINNLNVRVVKGGGVGVKLETWGRNQRRQKKRERESSNKEPVSAEKREERRKAAEEKQKKEAAERMEARRQKHNEDNGQNLSLDEFKSMEEEAKQQMRQSGRSSTGGTGQTRIHAFFQPKTGGDDAPPSQSAMSTVGLDSLAEAAVMEEGGGTCVDTCDVDACTESCDSGHVPPSVLRF
jgi:flagellar biosynthesis GTPase FlhF